MHLFRILSLPFIVLLPLFSASQPTNGVPAPEILRKLDSIAVQDVPPVAPGIATAIIANGRLVYEKYAGYADFSDSSHIGPDTRFNIASNGKQFTALAILMLEADGKLRLEEDIRHYLPDLLPAIPSRIAIYHLLSHSSGIRDVYDLWALQGMVWWKKDFSNQDALSLLHQQQELNFEPGAKYSYSNSNYIILAHLIEKLSGQSFTSYTNHLFDQLGMHQTSFECDHQNIRGPIARAYFNFSTWSTYPWEWEVCGDGNLFTTLKDQIAWEQILQGSRQTSIHPQIIRKSQEALTYPIPGSYGYGLERGEYRGMPCLFHEGATGAWKATVLRFPDRRLSFLTFTNTGKAIPAQQTRQMADQWLQLTNSAPSYLRRPARQGAPVTAEQVAGVYLTESDFAFVLDWREGRLWLQRAGRNDVELELESNNIYRQRTDTAFRQEFVQQPDGSWKLTVYYPTHAPYSLIKREPDWTEFDPGSIVGDFVNDETGTEISIRFQGNRQYTVKIAGGNNSNGLLVSPRKMLVNNYRLRFERKSNKTFIRLDGDRIADVLFRPMLSN